jgi:uncharacterized membrane protein YeiB
VILPFALAALLVAIRRQWLPVNAWWLGAALATVMTGGAWLSVSTGEAEEHHAEKIVAESLLEQHEEAAEQFSVAASVAAAIAIAAGFVRRRDMLLAAHAAATVAALGALALGIRAGQLGGELVYRHGAANAYVLGSGGSAAASGTTRTAGDDD